MGGPRSRPDRPLRLRPRGFADLGLRPAAGRASVRSASGARAREPGREHARAIATCASKVATTALLLHAGLPSPATGFLRTRGQATAFIAAHGDRAVFKPVYGYDGNGIRLVESADELEEPPYYLQEYVPNDEDYRVFVIGDDAVGAIRRTSPHLTHNIHQGGRGEAVAVTPAMARLAVAAARAVGADYAGVDLLPAPVGFTVLEVNGTPNWHCMAAPIPALLAVYLVRCAETVTPLRR